jgi:hypothetical protein
VRHWDEVAFIILLMIATVAVIDFISGRVVSRMKVRSPSARQHAMVGMRMRAWALARGSKAGESCLTARSWEKATSSAVITLPSWNCTPSRSVMIQRLLSAGSTRQALASPGRSAAGFSQEERSNIASRS